MSIQKQLYLGQHYIAQFFDCQFDCLNDPQAIQQAFLSCAQACNASIICSKFHKFNPFGVSGVVIIAQSHLTIHTWPQYKYAAIDVFTCSTKMRSGRCVQILSQSFKCLNYQSCYIPRGYVNNLHLTPQQFEIKKQQFIDKSNFQNANTQKLFQQSYIYEQGVYSRFGIPYQKVLENKKSRFQQIKVLQSSTIGKILLLDGVFMICQKTEANYHEMMVHPMVQILLEKGKKSLNVLIIGGGDGGAARQLLRYSEVKYVKVCELDGQVIQVCRKHIPQTANSFNDPRVQIFVSDGLKYVSQTQDKWDLILCDGCDPIGQACNLFSNTFYNNCYKILNQNGIFLTQGQSIYAYKDQFLLTAKVLKQVFGKGNSSLLFYHQPIYQFGLWTFQMAIKTLKEQICDLKEFSRKNLNQTKIQEFVEKNNLKYYNYEIHLASFAIPNEFKNILKEI